jgi:hypothetical protein
MKKIIVSIALVPLLLAEMVAIFATGLAAIVLQIGWFCAVGIPSAIFGGFIEGIIESATGRKLAVDFEAGSGFQKFLGWPIWLWHHAMGLMVRKTNVAIQLVY